MPRHQLPQAPCIDEVHVNISLGCNYAMILQDVDQYFPNAVSIVDSFHVIKIINNKILRYIRKLQAHYRKLDEKRHENLEQQLGRHIEFTSSKEYYLLKHFKWLILKNADDIAYSGYECQLESEPRARLILSHLCSFESEPPKHRSSNDPDGRSPHSYLGHRI